MKKVLLTTITLLVLTGSLLGQSFYNADITINGTYTSNIYKNYLDSTDYFTSTKASLNLYPLAFSEFNFSTEYKRYNKNSSLTNLNYGAGVTILPLNDSSKFSVYMNINYQEYSYEEESTTVAIISLRSYSSEYADKNINGTLSFGYLLNAKTNIRSGIKYTLTGYTSDSISDKTPVDLFTGINFSFFGKNAIDIEAGYTLEKYDYLPEFSEPFGYYPIRATEDGYAFLEEADLNSYYFSIRYSRPIFDKTGISMSYNFRQFTDLKDSALLFGASTGYLSPWVSSYDGNSVQAILKTYIVPFTIVKIGGGYWNSIYLNTMESETIFDIFLQEEVQIIHTQFSKVRKDDKYRIFATFSTPIATSSGRLLVPSLTFDYTDNKSNIANYTYTDFTVSMGLNLR